MAEEGLPPKEATRKSMGQFRALWSVSRWYCRRYSYRWPLWRFYWCYLSSVLYYHCFSMALSVLVALILTPALCATMLNRLPKAITGKVKKASSAGLTHVREEHAPLHRQRRRYSAQSGRYLVLYLIIVVGMAYLFVVCQAPSCQMRTRAYL